MKNARDIFEGRLATFPPGHGDLLVVTMVGGKVVYVEPITAYEVAVRRAEYAVAQLRWRRPFTVKVLPLSGREAQSLGLLPEGNLFDQLSPYEHHQWRERIRKTCAEVGMTTKDADVLADVYDTMQLMGGVH